MLTFGFINGMVLQFSCMNELFGSTIAPVLHPHVTLEINSILEHHKTKEMCSPLGPSIPVFDSPLLPIRERDTWSLRQIKKITKKKEQCHC
jgi:hypothetical protein